ncbi:cytochrome P450 [Antrihabitans spumae]|uniref:Cytochrome P450 n=1 Tax=Antrihabitans spumae TaxID=3373370 RepID=A0ABW7KFI6_9NOCA
MVTAQPTPDSARRLARENRRFFEIPSSTLLDRLLRLAPERSKVLAEPPPGSGLRPVVGDMALPFVGNGLAFLRWGPALQLDLYRRFGPVSWCKPLGNTTVFVTGPEATQVVVSNKDKAFGQGWDYYIERFFPRGLLLLQFDEHMFHRRLMQHAFTRDRLDWYFAELTTLADTAIARWPADRELQLYPTIKSLTLEIAGEIFMAADVGPERDRLNDAFVACTRAPLSVIRFPIPGGHWRAGIKGRKVLEEYFYRMLPSKRESVEGDFFSALCHAETEDGERFSDEDVVDHMIFLIMAAHDTSTITATTVAYYLGKHPEWQDRVRAEVLARPAGPLDIAALEQLKTLEMVIKECLRLVAPVPGLVRKTVKDTEILGQYIPAGVTVAVDNWVNHLLPEYWTEPEQFDPDRFSDERREDKSHRYAWVPFGAGAHKCIGMHFGMLEVKTILDAMLRNYEWTIPADYEMPWSYSSMPFPRDGAPVVLHRRG